MRKLSTGHIIINDEILNNVAAWLPLVKLKVLKLITKSADKIKPFKVKFKIQ